MAAEIEEDSSFFVLSFEAKDCHLGFKLEVYSLINILLGNPLRFGKTFLAGLWCKDKRLGVKAQGFFVKALLESLREKKRGSH